VLDMHFILQVACDGRFMNRSLEALVNNVISNARSMHGPDAQRYILLIYYELKHLFACCSSLVCSQLFSSTDVCRSLPDDDWFQSAAQNCIRRLMDDDLPNGRDSGSEPEDT
jgi:hypothetical protein